VKFTIVSDSLKEGAYTENDYVEDELIRLAVIQEGKSEVKLEL